MNTLVKILVESKFNFNIDIEDNKDLYGLSKLKYKSINLKNALIINAFKNKDLSSLDSEQRKYLYDNFEDFRQYQYKVEDKEELKDIIKNAGINEDLNWIDVSKLTNLYRLFLDSDFNGDISNWDVSNVENMVAMFKNSKFNGDLSKWNLIKITDADDINNIFENCPLEYNVDVKQMYKIIY